MENASAGLITAAPASGSGKTIVTLGLIAALRRAGYDIAAAKAGPDYIDAGFLAAAAGSACLNLDPWAMRPETVSGICATLAESASVIVCEGVMGLFDGARDGSGSTADLAALTGWPVILIVDASGQAASAAAVVRGFATHRADIEIAGVIFNRLGSEGHRDAIAQEMGETLPEIPVLGFVPRDAGLVVPERHLGLVQASEHETPAGLLAHAADIVDRYVDLDRVAGAARPARIGTSGQSSPLPPLGQHIAVARDPAFSFAYESVLDGWRRQNAEVSFFSPLADEPPLERADAIYLPGGYPELHAGKLARNRRFRAGLQAAADRSFIYGECGGFMVLGECLTDRDGEKHPMMGLLPIETSFASPKLHLGYRYARARKETPLGPVGIGFRGHEFHYSTLHQPSADQTGGQAEALFDCEDATGCRVGNSGLLAGRVAGSFVHLIDRTR